MSFSQCCESFSNHKCQGYGWVIANRCHSDNGVIVDLNNHFMTHVPLNLTNDRSNNRTHC